MQFLLLIDLSWYMAVYMNGYFEHTKDALSKSKKHQLENKMLQEKLTKMNEKARKQVNASIEWAEDAEVALLRAMEENSILEGIWEAQMVTIKKLEALLKAAK